MVQQSKNIYKSFYFHMSFQKKNCTGIYLCIYNDSYFLNNTAYPCCWIPLCIFKLTLSYLNQFEIPVMITFIFQYSAQILLHFTKSLRDVANLDQPTLILRVLTGLLINIERLV